MKADEQFEVTFLGTGTSHGVPMIGCDCAVCTSQDARDQRLRTAIHIRTPGLSLAVDTPPEFRLQCLREKISRLDAVLFTHSHTDHTSGFDDLRRFSDQNGGVLPVFATTDVLDDLFVRFRFAFDHQNASIGYLNAVRNPVRGPFHLGDVFITPVTLPHGRCDTTGFVFSYGNRKRLAYFTDCNAVPEVAIEAARGVDVLVIDTLRWRPHPTHLSVEQAIAFADRIGAERTFSTHISHDLGHAATNDRLPPHIRLAYDGLKLML